MSCLQSLFTEQPRKTALVSALCWSVLLSCQQLGSGGAPRGAQGVSTHERLLAPGHRQCYFFPRTPTGHFPGEGFLAECVGTAPFSCLQRAQSRPVGRAEISAWDQHFPSPLAHNKLQTKQLGLGGFSCHSLSAAAPIPGTKQGCPLLHGRGAGLDCWGGQ